MTADAIIVVDVLLVVVAPESNMESQDQVEIEQVQISNHEEILNRVIYEMEEEYAATTVLLGKKKYNYRFRISPFVCIYHIGLEKKRTWLHTIIGEGRYNAWRVLDKPDVMFGVLHLNIDDVNNPILEFNLDRNSWEFEEDSIRILRELAKRLPFKIRMILNKGKW